MNHVGILAYGSLIEDPGDEIKPLISRRISGIQTPFCVEFARTSNTRNGAPTLVPLDDGGAEVDGVILVLDSEVDIDQAEDLLWRRETRNEYSDRHYNPPKHPGPNHVLVEQILNFSDVEVTLYTKIAANIENRSAEHLADLAISSARGKAGAEKKDGISYLMSVRNQGIQTALQAEYAAEILRKTKANSLEESFEKVRSSVG